jgi:putative ABC transport system permease protein
MAATAEEIREVMRRRHNVQPGQDDTFWLRNLSEVMQAKEDASRAMTILLASVAAVSLLVGGIGIMNIMLVSVTERTREIGIRLAVGARGSDILAQFLVEAVTLSVIGGLIGIIVGVTGALLIGELGGMRVELEAEAVLVSIGSAVGVGVFFGFYPARRAARLAPVDALRYE